ncbi:MAG: cupin domain-containing protein [Caulobacteraceae bacterium]
MEEAMRLHGDVPFGWAQALQSWLTRRAAARRTRKAGPPGRADNLARRAAARAGGRRPDPLARIGDARLEILNVEAGGLAPERHFDHDEAVLMLEGQMVLDLDGRPIPLGPGDFQLIAAGRSHAIRPGGLGAFLLIAAEPLSPPTWPLGVRGLA